MLFADFPNTKFWFPEFFFSYAWHVTDFINLFYLNVFFVFFFQVIQGKRPKMKGVCNYIGQDIHDFVE